MAELAATHVTQRPYGGITPPQLLIPETLRLTNLGKKAPGDRVNIEFDDRTVAIVETVERVLEQRFEREQGAAGGP